MQGRLSDASEGPSPSLAAGARRARGVVPVVHVGVPVEVVTLLRRRRAVEPTRTDGLGARLGATADDELAVVEHVARPGDVHGDSEGEPGGRVVKKDRFVTSSPS